MDEVALASRQARKEVRMKRTVTAVIVWTAFTGPLAAAAPSSDVVGGHAPPATGGQRGMPDTPSARATAPVSEGEVRRVDSARDKLTLRHHGLANLDMPAMTMVFRVRDPAWLAHLRVGDKVHFVAERVDGNVTVTALQPVNK
jgi:Cu/Ag efflux protein CusF